ncbi:zinc finger, PMZ-type containing protein [Tanacetum coccineum]
MARDANNQMYLIAWAVVDVENKNNWCWFLSLLADDLELQDGLGLTIISDSHKGLIEDVKTWLANAEHRHCCRHICKLKKQMDWSLKKRLFWYADASTIEQDFAVAAYMKQKIDPDLGVSNSYSQSKWFDTYKFSIKPVYGYKMWKPTRNTPPLPPIVKTMPGRPRKSKIKHPSEQEHEHAISRASRVMTCTKYQRTGHNKASNFQRKDIQAEREVMQETMLEERRKQEER